MLNTKKSRHNHRRHQERSRIACSLARASLVSAGVLFVGACASEVSGEPADVEKQASEQLLSVIDCSLKFTTDGDITPDSTETYSFGGVFRTNNKNDTYVLAGHGTVDAARLPDNPSSGTIDVPPVYQALVAHDEGKQFRERDPFIPSSMDAQFELLAQAIKFGNSYVTKFSGAAFPDMGFWVMPDDIKALTGAHPAASTQDFRHMNGTENRAREGLYLDNKSLEKGVVLANIAGRKIRGELTCEFNTDASLNRYEYIQQQIDACRSDSACVDVTQSSPNPSSPSSPVPSATEI